ncbi:MAG TPA: carboxypeptidase-like regulatory domain-containing protein [Rhizomicrobium sp.]|jgi:hypothetical protein
MKFVYAACAALLAGACAGFVWPAKADVPAPMDKPFSIGGIDTVCTGIGDDAQHDPRWLTYPIRIEFANAAQQYLSGAHVVLTGAGGKSLATLDCDGAWVLFRLPPGMYHVTATLLGQSSLTASGTFSPPPSGQKRVILNFGAKANP